MKPLKMLATLLTLALLLSAPSALALDGRDITEQFVDPNFKSYVLKNFDADKNGRMTTGEVEQAKILELQNLEIQSLAGIEYFTQLQSLFCFDNQLASLDLSKNTQLIHIYCYNNRLTELKLPQAGQLRTVYCSNNLLKELDVSHNAKLWSLHCDGNQLSRLDLRDLAKDASFECHNNNFASMSDLVNLDAELKASALTLRYYPQNVYQADWVNHFTDVSQTDWFYEDLKFAQTQGVLLSRWKNDFSPGAGYSDESNKKPLLFDPAYTMNRIELITTLYIAAGAPYDRIVTHVGGTPPTNARDKTMPFTDVQQGGQYLDALLWGLEHHIVSGVSETAFAPYAKVSRQDFAVMLARYARAMDQSLPAASAPLVFADSAQIAPYAQKALSQCVQAGLFQGDESNRLNPWGPVTNAQSAAILHRFILMQQ